MKIFRFSGASAISLLLCCALMIALLPLPIQSTGSATTAEGLSARSAILIDADELTVLCEKNSRNRMGEASTTKIMTALVAAEAMPLDKRIKIPPGAVGIEGSSVYLCEGEILTVRELLLALLLASANDAATALALSCAGSVESFAQKMNDRARALGLSDTNFKNPHGLFDTEHYTTAHDLALISAEALKNPSLREIFSTKNATIPLGVTEDCPNGEGERYLKNHNRLLSLYKGAIGVKTGFTKKTGRCLVSAAERDGMTLIAVTLNAPDDWRDHTALLDYGFENYERVTLYSAGEFSYQYPVSGGCEQFVCATNAQPLTLTRKKSEQACSVSVEFPQRFEIAPIAANTTLGTLYVHVGDLTLSSALVAAHAVDSQTRTKSKKSNKFFIQD